MSLPPSAISKDVFTDLNAVGKEIRSADRNTALKKVAQQFESMFINIMLKNMRNANAVFEEDSLFNSNESDFYRDMHDHQLSLTLSKNKGLGIADVLYRQLQQSYGVEETNSKSPKESRDGQAPRVEFSDSRESFVEKVLPYVEKAAKALGVDAKLLTAQSALETGWGKYMLADDKGEPSFNLFNIKRSRDWQGESVDVRSLEEKQGVLKNEVSEFKVYKNIGESIEDYVDLLKNNERFSEALKQSGDATGFIRQLQKSGYATDSKYAEKVMSVYTQIKSLLGDNQ